MARLERQYIVGHETCDNLSGAWPAKPDPDAVAAIEEQRTRAQR